MTKTSSCLDVTRHASYVDRQQRWDFRFDVPESIRMHIDFRFAPGEEAGFRNLVTLSIEGPKGFRGAAHRWQPSQAIEIGPTEATYGFLSGTIEPGEWVCSVDLHEVLNAPDRPCTVELRVSVSDRREAPALPDTFEDVGVDPSKSGWVVGDLHCHTLHSDGAATVAEMASAARSFGLDFLAVTGHNTTSPMLDRDGWPRSLLAIRGYELTTFRGHAGILGLSEMVDWSAKSPLAMSRILDDVQHGGGLAAINHPFAQGNPLCTGCRWDFGFADIDKIDAIEVWNGAWSNWEVRNPAALALWDDLLNEGHRLTAIAGSDAHDASAYGSTTPFCVVHVDSLDEASVLDAVRRGHVYLSVGPRIALRGYRDGVVSDLLPGSVVDRAIDHIEIDVSALADPATVMVVSDLGVEPHSSIDAGASTTRMPVPEAKRWMRWELRRGTDPDGDLLALTNPIFKDTAA